MTVEDKSWTEDLKQLRRSLHQASVTLRETEDRIRKRFGTDDPLLVGSDGQQPPVRELWEELTRAASLADELSARLGQRPLDLFLGGHQMSREEFYLLVALGVLRGGSHTGDAYADFQMLRYEDDERRCYISLQAPPTPGYIHLRLGAPPEEIAWMQLRDEQREFFEKYLPEVAQRFRREHDAGAQ